MIHKFRKLGLSAAVLAAGLSFAAPQKADARVRIGVTLGAPVYSAPVAPYRYDYQAPDPYAYDYGYAAPTYTYPAPAYVAPAAPYFSFGWGGHDRREHERHEFREHHEHDAYRDWRR